jgi:hypothetical protein
MSPEEKSLLERTYKMSEENNSILRSIRRSNRFSGFMRVLYWIVIIGISYGLYAYLQPYIKTVMDVYDQVKNNIPK